MIVHKVPLAGLALYMVVAATLVCGIGGAIAAIVNTAVTSEPSARIKSPLDLRVENAREVKMALAKPVTGPPPLPPITHARRPKTKVASRRSQQAAMQRSRQIFANMERTQPSPSDPSFGLMAFGR